MANMKNKRKYLVKEGGAEVYTNGDLVVSVAREASGNLCFESNNKYLNHFLSFDIAESVAAFMRIRTFKDEGFWSIIINDRYYDVDAEKCLYWLSGGDKVWRNNDRKYKYTWSECRDLFTEQFSEIIYDIVDESKNLNDIKQLFRTHLNLNVLYEFALDNDLIK